jgi:DNA-binding Lrp family transcriptional regulator
MLESAIISLEDKRMTAYVLINTEIGGIPEVLEALKKIKNVKSAHAVYGVYDIVTKVEAESLNKIKETLTLEVRRSNKVRSTLTMIAMEDS